MLHGLFLNHCTSIFYIVMLLYYFVLFLCMLMGYTFMYAWAVIFRTYYTI